MQVLQVRQYNAAGIEVIYRHVEEALYLIGMQVHRYHTVDACHAEQVGNEFGADRHTRLVLAVLSCPTKVRYYGNDVACRSTLGSVYHEQKLHEVV